MTAVPPNALFSALSFIGFVLSAIPVPLHLRLWNTGICLFMLWTSITCLVLSVNSIVWNNNVVNWAPVWCDISSRYLIGAIVGIPASSLCIIRRLYYIISTPLITTRRRKWTPEIMIDLSIGIGLPFLIMALEYVVQGKRFAILEEIGCFPVSVDTIETYFLVYMWPVLLGLISLVFATLTFRLTCQQKAELETVLDTNCSISIGRYWRWMALCVAEIIFTVPLGIYVLITVTLISPPIPYNWAVVHTDFSVISQVPSVVWQSSSLLAAELEIMRWSKVLCAFINFAYLGWGEEARDSYRRAFWRIARQFGYSEPIQSLPSMKPQQLVTFAANPTLPLYVDYELRRTFDTEHIKEFTSTVQSETNLTASQNTTSHTFDSEDYRYTLQLEMPTVPAPAFMGSRDWSRPGLDPI